MFLKLYLYKELKIRKIWSLEKEKLKGQIILKIKELLIQYYINSKINKKTEKILKIFIKN